MISCTIIYIVIIFAILGIFLYTKEYSNIFNAEHKKNRIKSNLSKRRKYHLPNNSIDVDSIVKLPTKFYKNDLFRNYYSEQSWYFILGTPLISADEKKKYYAKIQKNFRNYEESLGKFIKYQTDNNTIIKMDTKIDPLEASKSQNNLGGKPVKDIYDALVDGPKFKPKYILGKTDSNIIYENESELNGAKLKGSNLYGYNKTNFSFRSAKFDNDF
ncbi:MAG: hypothetical protein QXW79_00515 [Thermoplasmata archaeon]